MTTLDTWALLKTIDEAAIDEIANRRERAAKRATWERLVSLRRAECEREMPHARCCDLGARFLCGHREIDFTTSPETPKNGGRPVWELYLPSGPFRSEPRENVAISFCPFCGVRLPGFRKKAEPPPHVAVENDHSCGGCGEPWDSCFCSLPESAWEVEP